MSKINFTDYYNQQDEVLEEDSITGMLGALGGNIATGIANLFRKRKGVNLAADFFQVFDHVDKNKYINTLSKLSEAYTNKTKWKNLYIKDIRFGEVSGNIANLFSKGSTAKQIAAKVPNAADMESEADLYKSKIHKMDISVYLISNGGKISLWNIPKTGTNVDSAFNADNRVYAISMNNSALKAFETIMGMSYQNWLVSQQAKQEEKQKSEDEKKKQAEKEQRNIEWKELVEVDKKIFDILFKIKVGQATSPKVLDKVEDTPVTDTIKQGKRWHITNPEGWVAIYQNNEGKYKVGFSDKSIREWVNKQFGINIPAGVKPPSTQPESTKFKDFYIGE